jgi:hypothetical protein
MTDSQTTAAANAAAVRRFCDLLFALDPRPWIELWTEDGIFEMPYATPGFPSRLEGVDAIWAHVRDIASVFSTYAYHDLEIVGANDPDVVFATLRSDGIVTATGRRYANRYITRFNFRDGKVARYVEWFDPAEVLQAFAPDGDVEGLRSAFNVQD